MLSPRWRKVVRDLWTTKMRTLLVVLSIAVGVFAVGMIAGIQVIMGHDLSQQFTAINPASATLYVSGADQDLVDTVAHTRDLRAAEGKLTITGRSRVGSASWKPIALKAVNDYRAMTINLVRPVAGAWPPGKKEVLIERASVDFLGVKIGDVLTVEMPDGKKHSLRVAGIVHDLNSFPGNMAGQGAGYVTFDTMEMLGAPRYFNEVNIQVAKNPLDKAHIQAVAARVRDKLEKSGRTVYYTYIGEPGKHPVDSAIQAFLMLLGALGFMSLLLSGFLVVNTVSALLAQQTRQIGVMKSIGARRGQIVSLYLTMVFAYGLLALFLAVPLGAVAANRIGGFLASMMNFNQTTTGIPGNVLILEIGVGLLVPLLAALWPVLSGTRITVREALSIQGIGKMAAGRGLLDRLLQSVRILSRPLLLSLRNTFRRKGRLALTLTTLVLGGAIFIAIFSVKESTSLTLDDALQSFAYDVEFGFSRSQRFDQLEHEALKVPGVAEAEAINGTTARRVRPNDVEGPNLTMLAVKAETRMIQPILLEGRWLKPGDENAIVVNTLALKEEKDVELGDDIVLKINDKKSTWRVVGIVRGVMTGPIVYVTRSYFAQVVSGGSRTGALWVVIDHEDAASRAQTMKAVENHFQSIGLRVSSMQAMADLRAQIESQFNIIIVFLMIMAVLLAIVGGLGLMGTMSLNVMERTREIGVMRAIGASDLAVQKVVMVEGVLIGVLSWLASAVIAFPASRFMSDQVGMAFLQAPLSPAFSLQGALVWLGIVVGLSALASFLPARNASHISVREVLAYE